MKMRTGLLLALGGLVVWAERRRALRPHVEPVLRHSARNLVVATLSAATINLVEAPVVMPLARLGQRRRWGLVRRLPLPSGLRDALAVILMDYTLYVWHILVHRVPWLWRLHLVHHVDLDLDASTGIRFHAIEMAASMPWRAAQVAVIGTSLRALHLWQALTLASIIFHHSNTKLPIRIERWLAYLLVTPRMHGIHHSIVQAETHSNFSSGLTIWDWLHGTLRLNIPQREITIGVPAYRDPEHVRLPAILALPITHDRNAWRFLDGREPAPTPPVATTRRNDLAP
ncbi:MAG: sterol desaturase family protein [Vicinamibacteraceae bacterium]